MGYSEGGEGGLGGINLVIVLYIQLVGYVKFSIFSKLDRFELIRIYADGFGSLQSHAMLRLASSLGFDTLMDDNTLCTADSCGWTFSGPLHDHEPGPCDAHTRTCGVCRSPRGYRDCAARFGSAQFPAFLNSSEYSDIDCRPKDSPRFGSEDSKALPVEAYDGGGMLPHILSSCVLEVEHGLL